MDFLSEGWNMFTSSIKSVAEKIKESDIKEDLQNIGKKIKSSQGWEKVTSFFSNITDFNKDERNNHDRSSYNNEYYSNNNNNYINNNEYRPQHNLGQNKTTTKESISRNTRKGWYDEEEEDLNEDINEKVDKDFITEDSGWDDWDEW